jgi:hypothetical protein
MTEFLGSEDICMSASDRGAGSLRGDLGLPQRFHLVATELGLGDDMATALLHSPWDDATEHEKTDQLADRVTGRFLSYTPFFANGQYPCLALLSEDFRAIKRLGLTKVAEVKQQSIFSVLMGSDQEVNQNDTLQAQERSRTLRTLVQPETASYAENWLRTISDRRELSNISAALTFKDMSPATWQSAQRELDAICRYGFPFSTFSNLELLYGLFWIFGVKKNGFVRPSQLPNPSPDEVLQLKHIAEIRANYRQRMLMDWRRHLDSLIHT